jgi:hypothetical protein
MSPSLRHPVELTKAQWKIVMAMVRSGSGNVSPIATEIEEQLKANPKYKRDYRGELRQPKTDSPEMCAEGYCEMCKL